MAKGITILKPNESIDCYLVNTPNPIDMINLETQYMGLKLKNPIIIASSGLTNSIEKIKDLEKAGAGAIVLKSIFEEEIYHELQEELSLRSGLHSDPEYLDYFDYVIKDENIRKYLKLISDVKAKTSVPIVVKKPKP